MEIWKPVPEFEGLYEASDCGRIRRLARDVHCGAGGRGVRHLPSRIVKLTESNGYYRVNLWRNNEATPRLAHRIIAAAWIGPSELTVDHIDGDGLNNSIDNLRYCTLSQNTLYQHQAGRTRSVTGELNGKSKLLLKQVLIIKSLLNDGESSLSISKQFGVSKGAIQAIREGRTWRDV